MERPDIARYVEYIESRPLCVQKTCLSSRGTVLGSVRQIQRNVEGAPIKIHVSRRDVVHAGPMTPICLLVRLP